MELGVIDKDRVTGVFKEESVLFLTFVQGLLRLFMVGPVDDKSFGADHPTPAYDRMSRKSMVADGAVLTTTGELTGWDMRAT
jgi:hypothetical protein